MPNNNICHTLYMSNINKPPMQRQIYMLSCIYIQVRNAYIHNTGKKIDTQPRLPDHLLNPTVWHHHKRLICSTYNEPLSIIIKVIESDYSHVNRRKNKNNTNSMFASFWVSTMLSHVRDE